MDIHTFNYVFNIFVVYFHGMYLFYILLHVAYRLKGENQSTEAVQYARIIHVTYTIRIN